MCGATSPPFLGMPGVYGIKLDESNSPVEESLAEVAPGLVIVQNEVEMEAEVELD